MSDESQEHEEEVDQEESLDLVETDEVDEIDELEVDESDEIDEVDEDVVLAVLPHGTGKLKVIQGGMEIEGREGSGDFTLIANAAVIAKLDL